MRLHGFHRSEHPIKEIHSGRLERWVGSEKLENLSLQFKDWYGPPVNIRDLPGSVWVTKGGGFIGRFDRGFEASARDNMWDKLKRKTGEMFWVVDQGIKHASREAAFGAGFAGINDALSRASQGYKQLLNGGQILKSGPTGVASVASTLWRLGSAPAAGAAGSAAPGGRACTSSTTGAMVYTNPASGTLHLVGAFMAGSVANNTLMLYDRIFDVAKTMNSNATEAVSGTPSRYQNTTANNADYAGGNFLFIEVGGTALAATAHNWTTCLYTDDAGNTGVTLPSVTGNASAIVDRFDMPTNQFFCPLASGDVGIKALTQMQCSAAVATGAINFVIGHPIGIMLLPATTMIPFDWLTNMDQAPRIFDSACLALIEMPKPSTTATTYYGQIYATAAA